MYKTLDYCTPWAYNEVMQNTSDLTRTACRNIPVAPSVLDRARAQARATDKAVIYLRAFGVGVSLPDDHATGCIWVYDSNIHAQNVLTQSGWEFEQLADIARVGGMEVSR